MKILINSTQSERTNKISDSHENPLMCAFIEIIPQTKNAQNYSVHATHFLRSITRMHGFTEKATSFYSKIISEHGRLHWRNRSDHMNKNTVILEDVKRKF